jgi:hypothetical protein
MSRVWSTLQATLGATSQGTWGGWAVVSGKIWDSSQSAAVSALRDRNTEADRAGDETLGESPDLFEGTEGTGGKEKGEGYGSTEEKDGENESVGREQSPFSSSTDVTCFVHSPGDTSFRRIHKTYHGRG